MAGALARKPQKAVQRSGRNAATEAGDRRSILPQRKKKWVQRCRKVVGVDGHGPNRGIEPNEGEDERKGVQY